MKLNPSIYRLILVFFSCFSIQAWSYTEPDWSEGVLVPREGRANIYGLSADELKKARAEGQIHTQKYPVSVTGVLLPEKPVREIIENKTWNPLKKIMNEIFKDVFNLNEFNDLFRWLGLQKYPSAQSPPKYQVAYPHEFKNGQTPDYLMGYSRIEKNGKTMFTMSCATCHAGQLFGQTVLGMTNRFSRANEFFIKGKQSTQFYSPLMFQLYTGASTTETRQLTESIEHLKSIEVKPPLALGLDTSLAQVALSLNLREPNEWADYSSHYQKNPRPDILDHQPADSKPAVWWNVKYKNRWLSDGSILSGNPIFTNFIWNELGRGTDLRQLDQWFKDNAQVVRDLTAMVFAIEAPAIQDFFPAEKINELSARRGEQIFNQTCARCHGVYHKNWSLPEFDQASWSERMKTDRVEYFEQTQVYDVGTDPLRYQAMQSLEQLNRLAVSKNNGIVVQAQEGYVPPPLVGIWARWPYFHNNSAPTLCAVLTPADQRPGAYYAVEAIDPNIDFDFDCNGYPEPQKVRKEYRTSTYLYQSNRPGLMNTGHDQGIFIRQGKNILSSQDKKDLIQFLQTL